MNKREENLASLTKFQQQWKRPKEKDSSNVLLGNSEHVT